MHTWSPLASPLASPPETWPDPDAMSTLQALLVFGGGTLGLMTVIALLVLAPSVVRGSRRRQGGDWWAEPLWFGGPVGAVDGEAGGSRRQLAGPAPAGSQRVGQATGGGAGARW